MLIYIKQHFIEILKYNLVSVSDNILNSVLVFVSGMFFSLLWCKSANDSFGEDKKRGSGAFMSTKRRQIPKIDANLFHFVFLVMKQIW